MPAVNKNFEDIITFTRGSGGGITNAQGNYEWLGNDVPRFDYDPVTKAVKGLLIEEQRTNLLTYSERFESPNWLKYNAVANPALRLSPSGDLTGITLTETTVSGEHFAESSISVVTGSTYTFSIYVAAAGRADIGLRMTAGSLWPGGVSPQVRFNLANETAAVVTGNPSGYGIVYVGEGLYRVFMTVLCAASGTAAARTHIMNTSNNTYTGDGTSGLYIWGAQLEQGSFPTSYIPTKATFAARNSIGTYHDSTGVLRTAAADVARYDHGYVDGQWVSKGLLLEGQSTNLLTYSEQFDNAAWNPPSALAGVTPNSSIAPDGALTADTLFAPDGARPYRRKRAANVAPDNTTYCGSIYLKKDAAATWQARIEIACEGGTGGLATVITLNLATGAVALSSAAPGVVVGVIDCGAYWRLWGTVSNNGSHNQVGMNVFVSSDAATGAYLVSWGAQLEAGTSPTSYIPTTTAQVTRVADSSTSSQVTRAADTVALNSLSPWFNHSEGTFVIKHNVPAGQVLLSSGANNIAVSQGPGTTFVAYDAAGSYVSQNGGSPVRGEPLSFDSSFNILKSSTATSSGWIESFKYHPIRKIAADD